MRATKSVKKPLRKLNKKKPILRDINRHALMLLTNITYFYHDDFDDDEGRQLTFSRNENNNVIFVFLLNKLRRPSP